MEHLTNFELVLTGAYLLLRLQCLHQEYLSEEL